MPPPFQPFSQDHLIAVIIGIFATVSVLIAGKRGGSSRQAAAAFLGFCNFAAYPLGVAAWLTLEADKGLDNVIPLHLCDLTSIIAGFALLTRKPLLAALTYFWGIAGAMQALVTPAITVGFPSWPPVVFFIQHFAIVATALYLPIVEGWRPKSPFWRTPLEIYGWSLAYLAFALGVNKVLPTNFGFAAHPPDNPSMIDHLGPWPWYLVWMSLIALVVFLLLALPFAGKKSSSPPNLP